MTGTRLAAVGDMGARGQADERHGGLCPLPSPTRPTALPHSAAGPTPATECGRRWRTWPGSTCKWGSRTWGG